MTIDAKDLLNSILQSLGRVDFVRPDDIPDIELYMDQVTTFMEQHLNKSRRYPDDKILTKTMINNYAKNDLLPPPEKKKYSRDHILLLIFIYYFKNILSISDIDKLFTPLNEKYFNNKASGLSLQDIYEEVFALEVNEVDILAKDITRRFNIAMDTFEDVDGVDGTTLRYFAFVCMLSFDVYMKKMLIEKIIDLIPEDADSKKKKK